MLGSVADGVLMRSGLHMSTVAATAALVLMGSVHAVTRPVPCVIDSLADGVLMALSFCRASYRQEGHGNQCQAEFVYYE